MVENYYSLGNKGIFTSQYVYLDTKEELAPKAFENCNIEVNIEDVMQRDDYPYIFVFCSVSSYLNEYFKNAMADLWRLVHIAGYKDYADECKKMQKKFDIAALTFPIYTFADENGKILEENNSIFVFLSRKKAEKKAGGRNVKEITFGNIELDTLAPEFKNKKYGLIDGKKKKFYNHGKTSKDIVELINTWNTIEERKQLNPNLLPFIVYFENINAI